MPSPLDALIFGSGLAGSILAEQLNSRGKSFVIIDNPSHSRCSRVAAGLINPIGGKRMNLVWMAEKLIPFAKDYFKNLSKQAGIPFFHKRPMARILQNEAETAAWIAKAKEEKFQSWIDPLTTLDIPTNYATEPMLGFAVRDSGFLDTNAFLDYLHTTLKDHRIEETFTYQNLKQEDDHIQYGPYQAKHAIFCEGHQATNNPYFDYVPFKPVKGVIGTIKTTLDLGQTIVLKGKFAIPLGNGLVRIGATYKWDDPTDTPDRDGLNQLENFLNQNFGNTWSWVEYQAGVRPATAGAYPVLGPSRSNPNIIAFNGFGSKGSMQIPYLAKALLDNLYQHTHLPEEAKVSRFDKNKKPTLKRWRATDVAKIRCLEALKPGSIAIDATAGNGNDSLWIADAIGDNGKLFIFDIQEKAISNTKDRLHKANTTCQTNYFLAGHETMDTHIPAPLHQKVDLIVFNLGYLPGGDKTLITNTDTTIHALEKATQLLSPSGLLSIVLYPAHTGGGEESTAVLNWFQQLNTQEFTTQQVPHPAAITTSPFPLFITKRN